MLYGQQVWNIKPHIWEQGKLDNKSSKSFL